MKIVIIGGTGLIGTKVKTRLQAKGHEVIASSPSTGVNTLTGEGLAAVLVGAEVVIDLTNSPSFEDAAVLEFFTKSGRNLLAAEQVAGVKHHIAVSIVGCDIIFDSGYMRAKVAQEREITTAKVPYTILRSTQFFEFLKAIANSGTEGDAVRFSDALIQPVAADDLADAIAELALSPPINGITEIAGPDAYPMHDLVRRYLAALGDGRQVIADHQARYFGALLAERALVPQGPARLGKTDFETWMAMAAAK